MVLLTSSNAEIAMCVIAEMVLSMNKNGALATCIIMDTCKAMAYTPRDLAQKSLGHPMVLGDALLFSERKQKMNLLIVSFMGRGFWIKIEEFTGDKDELNVVEYFLKSVKVLRELESFMICLQRSS
ncbi:hypothetical protein LguiB_012772 [Lonicera macranthoides]